MKARFLLATLAAMGAQELALRPMAKVILLQER